MGTSGGTSGAAKNTVILLGPARSAVSGVSTHLNLLFGSRLGEDFELLHFQVGREGRSEGPLARLARFVTSPLALAFEILRRDAAIVHINTSLNARAYWRDLAYLLVAKLCGARVVYQVHGGALPRLFFRDRRLPSAFLRATLKLPDALVVLAQSEFDAYREFVPGQPVIAIPNGIDYAPLARARRAPCAKGAPLRLVYVGRLAREKGLFETLKGLRLARSRGVSAELVIAGSGPAEPELRERIEALGLRDAVSLSGAVFGEAKAELLGRADVFVLPSYSEGLPYALLEAMAAGAVVIATPVGAIGDVMSDGLHGRLVPVRDAAAIGAAIESLTDRARLARMSAACRERVVAAYSIGRVAERFAQLYAELTSARPLKVLEKV
jgi:glycosyltransferase involved in cell wall biosynthesis